MIFEVQDILWNYTKDIDKVWTQAYHLFKTGFDYKLSIEEVAMQSKLNEEYHVLRPEEELLASHYRLPNKKNQGDFVTATDIIKHLNLCNQAVKLNAIAVGRAVNKVFKINRVKHGRVYGYMLVESGHWVEEDSLVG